MEDNITYWKIKFDEGLEGCGYIKFNQFMEQIALYDEQGNIVEVPVGYHPIEFENVKPFWDV